MARKLLLLFIAIFFVSIALNAVNKRDKLESSLNEVQIDHFINDDFVLPLKVNQNSFLYSESQNAGQQLPANAVSLSPNPTINKRFTITLKNLKGESRVAIYNVIGVLVKKLKMNSNKMMIDLNDFSKGIYLVNVSNNRRNLVKKIIVK